MNPSIGPSESWAGPDERADEPAPLSAYAAGSNHLPVRFRLRRDFVDVPVAHARRLIQDLERLALSPHMPFSAAAKIREAIAIVERRPRITFSLGEKITISETLRRVWEERKVLPPTLRELRDRLEDELERARNRSS